MSMPRKFSIDFEKTGPLWFARWEDFEARSDTAESAMMAVMNELRISGSTPVNKIARGLRNKDRLRQEEQRRESEKREEFMGGILMPLVGGTTRCSIKHDEDFHVGLSDPEKGTAYFDICGNLYGAPLLSAVKDAVRSAQWGCSHVLRRLSHSEEVKHIMGSHPLYSRLPFQAIPGNAVAFSKGAAALQSLKSDFEIETPEDRQEKIGDACKDLGLRYVAEFYKYLVENAENRRNLQGRPATQEDTAWLYSSGNPDFILSFSNPSSSPLFTVPGGYLDDEIVNSNSIVAGFFEKEGVMENGVSAITAASFGGIETSLPGESLEGNDIIRLKWYVGTAIFNQDHVRVLTNVGK